MSGVNLWGNFVGVFFGNNFDKESRVVVSKVTRK